MGCFDVENRYAALDAKHDPSCSEVGNAPFHAPSCSGQPVGFLLDVPGRPAADIVSRTCSAAASRRQSRKAVPIWALRRNDKGRGWRPSGARRLCWVCIRLWRCWRPACQDADSPGTTSSRRRSATPWQRRGTLCGRLSIFQPPRVSLQCLLQAVCYTH